ARSTTDNDKLVASLHTVPQTRKVTGDKLAGGEVVCEHGAVWERIGITTCTATAAAGATFDANSMTVQSGTGTLINCSSDGASCTLKGVTQDVTVSATFTKAPPPSAGNAAAVPTLGDIGLLLSSIALAGAAVPALRRRERKARKHD
ncbi:MAG: IPTL-CTERM sorting domain-containing protein, partial [Clostridia bacterium]|nr:IPTL-CTERM sorting domain-containing protein [Clostridia bacterium]